MINDPLSLAADGDFVFFFIITLPYYKKTLLALEKILSSGWDNVFYLN